MKKELLKGLTEEQIEKLRNCKDANEALQLAKEEGIELTEEQLEAVSGGICTYPEILCPICNSNDVKIIDGSFYDEGFCRHCGHSWRL